MDLKKLSNQKLSFFLTKPKILVYGLIIGLLVGIFGISALFRAGEARYREANTLSPSIVFSRIVSENEMVSASQQYNIVDKSTDDNTLFDIIHIPFTENSFWYRYCGTIKVGVNLKKATYETSADGKTITVTLDAPYIISNTPDMDKSGVLEENNNLLNPIHVEDVDAFQRKCIEQSETEIAAGGIFDEAKQNTEDNIRGMFNSALGDAYTVEFSWRDAASE
ncbi:DUF4230 domain-containing protein [Paratractidigestivibacter sp.]|uniref:DUF4230 domain-containing protein n=1 Tax=Paratractidigestivibacter sp. TaxID=2847316 RepID=UPI002AC8970B|nr:DUF4230 domain-containing protein [Paratractidigestivibacter sp.]